MRRPYSVRLALLGALVLAPLAVAEAGTVRGTVKNGTTGKAAAGIELILIQLQGGMQEVAHSKSGADGEFTFDHPGLGAQPMLVRAVYHGVNFNHAVPPGTTTAQVDIYEPSKDAKTINVRGGRARRNGVVEINAVIHRADENRLRTKSGMVEREFPVRSALRVRYLLHPSLKLDQDELDSRGCFAGRAVLHRAAHRPGLGYRQRSQNECAEQSQSHGVGAPHCALPSAGRVPR